MTENVDVQKAWGSHPAVLTAAIQQCPCGLSVSGIGCLQGVASSFVRSFPCFSSFLEGGSGGKGDMVGKRFEKQTEETTARSLARAKTSAKPG